VTTHNIVRGIPAEELLNSQAKTVKKGLNRTESVKPFLPFVLTRIPERKTSLIVAFRAAATVGENFAFLAERPLPEKERTLTQRSPRHISLLIDQNL
jgi:hypothetical protein